MTQYPDCPYCTNSNTSLSIVDVEFQGVKLKGIQCNSCNKYIGFFKDYETEIKEIREYIEGTNSRIDELES